MEITPLAGVLMALPHDEPSRDKAYIEIKFRDETIGVIHDAVKNGSHLGLPYGKLALEILAYFASHLLSEQSFEIPVGDNPKAFLKLLGHNSQPNKTCNDVKTQFELLSNCRYEFKFSERLAYEINLRDACLAGETLGEISDIHPINDLRLFYCDFDVSRWSGKAKKDSRVVLNRYYMTREAILDNCIHSGIYLMFHYSDFMELSSPLQKKLFILLADQLHCVPENHTEAISLSDLEILFGYGYSETRKFKPNLKTALSKVIGVYKAANGHVTIEDDHLLLKRADPALTLEK